MRIKFFLWVIGIGLIVGIYTVTMQRLQEKWETDLSHSFHQPVKISTLHGIFPPAIFFTDLTVGASHEKSENPFLSIQEGWVHFSFLQLLQGERGMNLEFTHPRIFLNRNPEGTINFPIFSLVEKNGYLSLSRLRIRDGELTFSDHFVSPENRWFIKDLRVSLGRAAKPGHQALSAIGSLEEDSTLVGSVEVQGDLSPAGAAEFKVTVTHRDLGRPAPYLKGIVGVAPAQGSCILKSTILLDHGRVIADTSLAARGVIFPTNEETLFGMVGNRLVEFLKDKEGTIHLDFVVKGHLGEQQAWSDLMTTALRKAIHQALSQRIQNVLTDVEERRPVEELLQKRMESLGR